MAVQAERIKAWSIDPNNLVIIGHDTEDGPEHVLYDERINLELDEGLIRNIMIYGVLEPVLARPHGDAEDQVLEVIDGRQRILAAREANERLAKEGKEIARVPFIVKKGEAHRVFGMCISANENRRDDDPLSRALKVQKYLDMSRSEQEAAVAFGVSVQSINNWLRLLELAEEVQEAVKKGEISANAAAPLADLPHDQQVKALAKAGRQARKDKRDKPTAKDTNKVVKNKVQAPPKRLLRQIIETEDEEAEVHLLDPNFVQGIAYALGIVKANDVPGLADLLTILDEAVLSSKKAKK
jgi:ParB family transcriptional regulator, chromosome partitioning protein